MDSNEKINEKCQCDHGSERDGICISCHKPTLSGNIGFCGFARIKAPKKIDSEWCECKFPAHYQDPRWKHCGECGKLLKPTKPTKKIEKLDFSSDAMDYCFVEVKNNRSKLNEIIDAINAISSCQP